MKAMILAAGKGERLRPMTETMPKPLIQVAGKPLILHHLAALAKCGISEVIINTWYLGAQIRETIGCGKELGLKIEYSIEDELLDTGGGIAKCLPFFAQDPFIVISADIYTKFDFITVPQAPNGLAHLIMVDNPSYHMAGDFYLDKGILKLDGGDKLTYANIGVFRPEFFVDAPKGSFPLRNLFYKHISNGLVTGQYFNGVWHNIGTINDLELANNVT